MRRKNTLPELLAPAGDMQCLYAAISGGADAVYVGGHSFGARAYAKNFDIEELSSALSYCHLHGVKLYVTVNTLVYDKELKELSDFAAELWRIGVDAVIVADLGAVREIKRRAPGLAIHASTQMSVHNTYGADAAAGLGCERVVLARELSEKDIARITDRCAIETEVFLHGALCVCHSGQCLMSSLVGGRSGNRGECAQPCRLPYNSKQPLSLSDLSLARSVPSLIDSGVASLKIEGRMKSSEYVYTVTKIYRRLLDERRCANRQEMLELREVFSRGEFTDGYFKGEKFKPMTGVRSEADKKSTRAMAKMDFSPEKISVKAEVKIKLGEPSEMVLLGKGKKVRVYGAVPTKAINSPLTPDGVRARLAKMGATMLSLDGNDVTLTLDENVNMSPSALNQLRRCAAAEFESDKREPVRSGFEQEFFARESSSPLKTAQFFSKEAYLDLVRTSPECLDFFDIAFVSAENFSGEANGVFIPPVIFDSEISEVENLLFKAKEKGARFALVGNIGHIEPAKRAGLVPVGDFRLNVTNGYARAEYEKFGVKIQILSPELTLPMARDIGGGEIVYGRVPLMVTERCFIKENFSCKQKSNAYLEDRTGARFPLICEYGHRNLLLNSRPTYMGDRQFELEAAKISHGHFLFTVESANEIKEIIESYKSGLPLLTATRRIGKR